MAKETTATRLRSFLSGEITSAFAMSAATGISEKEVALILVERVEPTKEQEKRLAILLKNYELAVKLVNVEMAKGQLTLRADNCF
jgi:hypothetical protein